MWAISGSVLLSIAVSGCGSSPPAHGPAESRSAAQYALTDQEYAAAVALARDEVRADEANVTSTTVTVGGGTVTDSNMGYHCASGRLLHIKLIGMFPHIATTGHPPGPDNTAAPEDFTVHAVLLTADAETGRACLTSVQTGDVVPEPGATVLAID